MDWKDVIQKEPTNDNDSIEVTETIKKELEANRPILIINNNHFIEIKTINGYINYLKLKASGDLENYLVYDD